MTNVKIPMPNECQNPKSQRNTCALCVLPFCHLALGFYLSFELWNLTLGRRGESGESYVFLNRPRVFSMTLPMLDFSSKVTSSTFPSCLRQ
jgi:hypothetical protein